MPETRFTTVGDIRIAWEAFGDPADPTLLLVPGTAAQMLFWTEAFCTALAAHGLYVVRMDPRDVGLSTHLDHLPTWPAWRTTLRYLLRRPLREPYTIADMADDVAGVLDDLGGRPAFVGGWSMGTLVVQTLAVRRPDLVARLVLFGTHSYARGLANPEPADTWNLLRPPDPQDPVARHRIAKRIVARQIGPHQRIADAELEAFVAELGRRRSPEPGARWRQLATSLAHGEVTPTSRAIDQPVILIHGTADTLAPMVHAERVHAALPDSRLERIPGMGHWFPDTLIPTLVPLVAGFLREPSADRQRPVTG